MRGPNIDDRGFTLLECMVGVAITLVLVGGSFVWWRSGSLSGARSRAVISRVLDVARATAAANNADSSGAVLVIEPTVGGSTVTILRGRPIPNFARPMHISNMPPLTVPAAVSLTSTGATSFSIAFSPSGKVDILPYAVREGADPIDAAPGCGKSGDGFVDLDVATFPRPIVQRIDCARGTVDEPASNAG